MSLLIKSLPIISVRSTRTLSSFLLINPTTLKTFSKNNNTTTNNKTASSSSAAAAAFSVSASAETTTASSNPPLTPQPLKDSLKWVSRTRYCGELTPDDIGKRVTLCGWVALHRVHGALTFLNLRDHTGTVQVTTLPEDFPEAHSTVNDLRLEYVVAVEGVVRSRPSEAVNEKMKTGFIETIYARLLRSMFKY